MFPLQRLFCPDAGSPQAEMQSFLDPMLQDSEVQADLPDGLEKAQQSPGGVATAGAISQEVANEKDSAKAIQRQPSSWLQELQPLLQSCAAAEQGLSGTTSATANCGKDLAAVAAGEISSSLAARTLPAIAPSEAAKLRRAKQIEANLARDSGTAVAEAQSADKLATKRSKSSSTTQPSRSKAKATQALQIKQGRVKKQKAAGKQKLQSPAAISQDLGMPSEDPATASKPEEASEPPAKKAGRRKAGKGHQKAKAAFRASSRELSSGAEECIPDKVHETSSTKLGSPAQGKDTAESMEILQMQSLPAAAEKPLLRQTRSCCPDLQMVKLPVKKRKTPCTAKLAAADIPAEIEGSNAQPSGETKSCMPESQKDLSAADKPVERSQHQDVNGALSSPFEEASLVGFPSQTLDENAPPLWISASAQPPSETDSEPGSPSDSSDDDNDKAAAPSANERDEKAPICIQECSLEEREEIQDDSAAPPKGAERRKPTGKLPSAQEERLILKQAHQSLLKATAYLQEGHRKSDNAAPYFSLMENPETSCYDSSICDIPRASKSSF